MIAMSARTHVFDCWNQNRAALAFRIRRSFSSDLDAVRNWIQAPSLPLNCSRILRAFFVHVDMLHAERAIGMEGRRARRR